MTTTKCSYEHLLEYNEGVNNYLKSKNINDFTKYETAIKDGKLFFIKWDYTNIQQPTNIQPVAAIEKSFLPCNIGIMFIDIKKLNYPANRVLYFNINGNVVHDSISSNPTTIIQETAILLGIISAEFEITNLKNTWLDANSLIGNRLEIYNGLLRLEKYKEKIDIYPNVERLIITVSYTYESVFRPTLLRSKQRTDVMVNDDNPIVEETITPVKVEPKGILKPEVYYTIPQNYTI
jgi:hypothetical protein